MKIAHNVAASNARMNASKAEKKLAKSTERLSSGYKINHAADDAAGLAISTKMQAQIRGMDQAVENAEDGISLIKTAEGGLQEIHSMLHRIREIAVQASNDINTPEERAELNEEVEKLIQGIDDIGNKTEFNSMKLLNGSFGKAGEALGSAVGGVRLDVQPGASVLEIDFDLSACQAGVTFRVAGIQFEFSDYAVAANQIQIGATQEDTRDNLMWAVDPLVFNKYDPEGSYAFASADLVTSPGYCTLFVFVIPNDPTADPVNIDFHYDGPPDMEPLGAVLQVGANSGQEQRLKIMDARSQALGIAKASVLDHDSAQKTITDADEAIKLVSKIRGSLGAAQNRLEHTVERLKVSSENTTASDSRIRDTDMAEEVTERTKNEILTEAAQSMMAQAGKMPETILNLLQ